MEPLGDRKRSPTTIHTLDPDKSPEDLWKWTQNDRYQCVTHQKYDQLFGRIRFSRITSILHIIHQRDVFPSLDYRFPF